MPWHFRLITSQSDGTNLQSELKRFYKRHGQGFTLKKHDQALVMLLDTSIVAALRIETKPESWYFLRAVQVAKDQQGQGLGRLLLQKACAHIDEQALGALYCYCPQSLQAFYAQCDFVSHSPQIQLPHWIIDGLQRYRRKQIDLCLMHRAPRDKGSASH